MSAARRFFSTVLPAGGGQVTLDEAQAGHVRVLRLAAGDPVVLFDAAGREAEGVIRGIDEKSVTCEVGVCRNANSSSLPKIVLVLGLPKTSQLESAVRMATELGAHEIRLCQTERSVPRWPEAKLATRLARLERIAQEASGQSERAGVPVIVAPRVLATMLEEVDVGAVRWVFHARGTEPARPLTPSPSVIWIAIGPEGGFSDAELELFEGHGFGSVSLGPGVLRVETAVAAALAVAIDRIQEQR